MDLSLLDITFYATAAVIIVCSILAVTTGRNIAYAFKSDHALPHRTRSAGSRSGCYGDRSRSGHIPVGFTTFCSGGDPTGRGTASTRNRPCHDRQRQVSVCIALRGRKRAARGLYDRSDSDRTPSQINAHHANSLLLHIAGWKQLTSGKRITPAT